VIQPSQDASTIPAISIRGVTKRFREKTAVDNLDLTVPRGSLCGFLGPNGAGKTTTIRMVMSIFPPDSGQISVLGRPTAIESKDLIGYLPEERGVYRKMKVDAFLTYIGMLKGVDRRLLKDRIGEWLERVELPGVQKKRCEELSKGMQQKVQFLATIIHDPELIILDEPFSGLDPVNGRLLRTLINDLHDQGKTIIFSTHVLQQAEQICDRIFLINNGKKLLDGTMDEIREQHNPRTLVIEPLGYQYGDDTSGIERIEGIASVRAVPVSGSTPPHLEATLTEGADHSAVLARVAQSVPLRRIESRRATLEDIFVSLVSSKDSADSVRASLRAEARPVEGE
jgi:ABC-2 type transport system ATP-binding protein